MSNVRLVTVMLLAVLTAGAARAGASDAAAYWQGVAATVAAAITDVETHYAGGDEKAARAALTEAYFARFEDSKMEAAIRQQIGQARAIEVEGLFGALRKAIKAGDGAAVTRLAADLRAALTGDAAALDTAGVPADVFAVNQ